MRTLSAMLARTIRAKWVSRSIPAVTVSCAVFFESLGYHVTKLDRVYFAGLTKKNLGRGKWRYLNEREVNALRMGAFE